MSVADVTLNSAATSVRDSLMLAVVAAVLLLLRAAALIGARRLSKRLAGPATVPFLAAAGCGAVLFAMLTAVIMAAPGMASALDEAVSSSIAPDRAPWLLSAFLWLTTLGTGAALSAVAVTATGFLWVGRAGMIIPPLWIAFGGAEATVWTLKYLIGRTRPLFLDGVASAVSPSFPSAHATGAAAVLGFVAYAVGRGRPSRREHVEIAFWTAILVALIGFSRVFLGVHFATDVIGGFLIGGAWLLIGIAVVQNRSASTLRRDR
jgi:membrane-associated phospholipid phosphatase